MIPTIEQIIQDVWSGVISKEQAIAWIEQHIANASDGMQEDLRDHFAGLALQGICASGPSANFTNDTLAREAYQLADAMMNAR